MANEMLWTTQSGVLANTRLDKIYRRVAQPLQRFRQFVDIKSAHGKSAGEMWNWNKVDNIGTYGGILQETNTMHEANQLMLWGTGTVREYGNSIPFTLKAETLSMFDINEILRTGLVDDMSKVMDGLVEIEFASTAFKMVSTATGQYNFTTNGTHTGTNTTGTMSAYIIRNAVLELKKKNVPGFTKLGGAYAGILNVAHTSQIQADLIDVKTVQYADKGYTDVLLNGEVGKLFGMRLVEDNFATQFAYDPTGRTATSKASNASGSRVTGAFTQAAVHSADANGADAYFFGSPTVMEGVAIPEGIRRKEITDYGRSKGIAWYFLGGWKIAWGGSTSAPDQGGARIIHFSSE
jgi:N4-gp56 family major capsid protein